MGDDLRTGFHEFYFLHQGQKFLGGDIFVVGGWKRMQDGAASGDDCVATRG
jgi:hypothetical protein